MTIKLRDGEVCLNEGQFYIIPKGVEHMPVAREECHVMLFEPKTVLNTGDKRNDKTVYKLESISTPHSFFSYIKYSPGKAAGLA